MNSTLNRDKTATPNTLNRSLNAQTMLGFTTGNSDKRNRQSQASITVIVIGLVLYIPLYFLLGQHIGTRGVVVFFSAINLFIHLFLAKQIRRILNNSATGIWNN